jgi:hypothetical protein
MQSMRDGDILHYQDHLTKFAVLRPLTSKLAAEVGFQLLDIFLLFGAPHCGREDVDSPIFASQPNIALYGDLFIPE